VEYAVTSIPRDRADADDLLSWWRGHWGIENGLHWVRDATFGEDRSRICTGHAPEIFAALRNAAISVLRLQKTTNVAAALRHLRLPRHWSIGNRGYLITLTFPGRWGSGYVLSLLISYW